MQETDTTLVFAPSSRLQAIYFAFSVSGYSWKQILTMEPVKVLPHQVLHCTKILVGDKSYYVLEFRRDLLSYVAIPKLPPNANINFSERSLPRFQFEWFRQGWKDGLVVTFAYFYYILGMFTVAFAWYVIARSASLSRGQYHSYLAPISLFYSFTFSAIYYRFARRRITAAWDLRSLQFQTLLIIAVSMAWVVRGALA